MIFSCLLFITIIVFQLIIQGRSNFINKNNSSKAMELLFNSSFCYSEVHICSNEQHLIKGWRRLYRTGFQISRCNSSADLVQVIKNLYNEIKSTKLQLYISFNTVSETLNALNYMSKYYIREDKFRNKLSIFVSWPSENATEFNTMLQRFARRFPINSQIYIEFTQENSTIAKYWEIYYVGSKTFTNEVDASRNLMEFEVGPQAFRNNFNNSIIKAVAVESREEHFFAKFRRNGSALEFESGFSVDLLNNLRDSLNFTVKAVPAISYITNTNTSVGGMGAYLNSKEADVAVSMSYILPYRLRHLTPSVHLHRDKITVFFRQPRQNTHRNIFVNPFSLLTWVVLAIMWMLFICFAYLMTLVRRKCQMQYYMDFYIWILGAVCQRGYHRSPSNWSLRIIFLTIFLMSFVIYAFYAASIISRLTVSYGALNSLQDLFEANFKFLADPLFQYSQYIGTIFSDFNSDEDDLENGFVNDVDSLQKAFQGGIGFVTSIDTVVIASRNLNISERQICDTLSNVPLDGLVLPLVFYFRKGSPLKEPFNVKLLQSMSRGLTHRYVKDFVWNTSPLCLPVETKSIEIIRFSDVISAFIGLGLAGIFSSFILLGEILCRYKYLKKDDRRIEQLK